LALALQHAALVLEAQAMYKALELVLHKKVVSAVADAAAHNQVALGQLAEALQL